MGRQQDGIYRDRQGNWWVDKVYRGTRLHQCFGQNLEEAQSWLIHQLEQLRQSHLFGVRAKRTFDDAAAKYLLDHQDKVSIESDIYHLGRLMPYIGQCTLYQIHDGTLEAFVRDRKARGLANKTINLGLTLVRRMLNLDLARNSSAAYAPAAYRASVRTSAHHLGRATRVDTPATGSLGSHGAV